jgi:hypothetical protein
MSFSLSVRVPKSEMIGRKLAVEDRLRRPGVWKMCRQRGEQTIRGDRIDCIVRSVTGESRVKLTAASHHASMTVVRQSPLSEVISGTASIRLAGGRLSG